MYGVYWWGSVGWSIWEEVGVKVVVLCVLYKFWFVLFGCVGGIFLFFCCIYDRYCVEESMGSVRMCLGKLGFLGYLSVFYFKY